MSNKLWGFIKVIGVIALLCFMVPIRINQGDAVIEQFKDYMKKYNKSYPNETEYRIRLKAFQNSLNKINKFNTNRTNTNSALYGLTKFSDLTSDEFLNNHLQLNLSKKIFERNLNAENSEENSSSDIKSINKREEPNIPSVIDWRHKGVVTEVKDQKYCGACWAFCVIENLETMHAIKTNKLQQFSVQELIDCAGNNNEGCDGGDMCTLLKWMNDTKVVVEEEQDYPLHLRNEHCKLKKNAVGAQIDSYGCQYFVDNEDYILQYLAVYGPVAVAINALSWQNYLEGVIQYHCSGSMTLLNHAVQIVGYNLTAEVPYYIVRNSWGKDFGDQGYLYIAIGQNMCGLAHEVTALSVL